ncbi:YvcK family protein [Candidatus Daviesbacteria bacterium]|nr:YvcK family protein [Candidatus Daviesbacteria bacterium]
MASTIKKHKYSQKIVTLGGGTGHYSLLRGLVDNNDPELISAITGTWDSGGSSGRLRMEMGVLPPGDTRQCLIALMEDASQRQVAQRLFNERLTDTKGPLKGHAIGNLIQSQLQVLYQGQDRGLDAARALFRVKSQIIPVSLTDLQLCAKTVNGNIIEGETIIDTRGSKKGFKREDKISRIYFDTSADPNPKALEAIAQADKIILSPGDLYTSILPHMLVNGMAQAVNESLAKVIFVLNLMTKKGETDNYMASDFLKSLLFYLGSGERLDYMIVNENGVSSEVREIYSKEGQEQIEIDEEECKKLAPNLKITKSPLAIYYPKEHLLRHDSDKLAEAILSL